jgi:hypothetical protein
VRAPDVGAAWARRTLERVPFASGNVFNASSTTRSARSGRWLWFLLAPLVAVALVAGVPWLRTSTLRIVGRALVVNESAGCPDTIVVGVEAHGAGVLETADLARQCVTARVAVFDDPPNAVNREFVRRGLSYEVEAERSIRVLNALGVTSVDRIPRATGGSEDEGRVLPGWCAGRRCGPIVVVTTSDHSRRLGRIMRRAMRSYGAPVTVRSSRHSAFDPNAWWTTRDGVRTWIIEAQKLLFDMVSHPLS